MLLNILQTVLQDIRDYTVDETCCTKLISPKDSCDKCVRACPLSCIRITKHINIDDYCVGCGICSQACPTQAIKMKLQTLDYIIHETDTNDHFVLGCQKQNKKSSAYFNQFCIGSLPDETILYLLLKKPAILEQFDHSKCKHCELVSGFDNFNKRKELLQTQLARSDFYKSQKKSDLPDTLDSEYDDDKRAFLMSFINVRKTLETINSEMNDSQIHFYQTYRSLLKKQPKLYGILDLKFPHISEKCSGCEACIRLCPSKALTREGNSISLNPSRCSNCGLCSEVCYDKAVTLKDLALKDFESTSVNIFS